MFAKLFDGKRTLKVVGLGRVHQVVNCGPISGLLGHFNFKIGQTFFEVSQKILGMLKGPTQVNIFHDGNVLVHKSNLFILGFPGYF